MKEEGDDDNAFYDVLPLSEVEEAGSTNPRQRCSKEFLFRCSQESALLSMLHPPTIYTAATCTFWREKQLLFISDFDLTMPTSTLPCVRALLCYLSHKQPN